MRRRLPELSFESSSKARGVLVTDAVCNLLYAERGAHEKIGGSLKSLLPQPLTQVETRVLPEQPLQVRLAHMKRGGKIANLESGTGFDQLQDFPDAPFERRIIRFARCRRSATIRGQPARYDHSVHEVLFSARRTQTRLWPSARIFRLVS